MIWSGAKLSTVLSGDGDAMVRYFRSSGSDVGTRVVTPRTRPRKREESIGREIDIKRAIVAALYSNSLSASEILFLSPTYYVQCRRMGNVYDTRHYRYGPVVVLYARDVSRRTV